MSACWDTVDFNASRCVVNSTSLALRASISLLIVSALALQFFLSSLLFFASEDAADDWEYRTTDATKNATVVMTKTTRVTSTPEPAGRVAMRGGLPGEMPEMAV